MARDPLGLVVVTVSALVAYRPTEDGWRDEAWRQIVRPYLDLDCDEEIVETPAPAGAGTPDDFNKPAAINRARSRARGDVLLVADADTYPGDVPDMVRLLERPWKRTTWVLPQRYVKLSRDRTRLELSARAHGYSAGALMGVPGDVEWEGNGVSWSAGVVCRAEDFDTAGGYDERFASWGADDVAFAMAMETLVGRVERHPCACYHYWHPGADGRAQPQAQHDLMWRYLAAAETGPDAMRELLAERA
jgi:hypothetical protein